MSGIKNAMPDSLAKGLPDDFSQELDELNEYEVIDPSVPFKYRGTVADKSDMQNLGKVQVLRVRTGGETILPSRSCHYC